MSRKDSTGPGFDQSGSKPTTAFASEAIHPEVALHTRQTQEWQTRIERRWERLSFSS